MTAPYLELNDRVRFLLTGELVKVVEIHEINIREVHEVVGITLRWPSGDRLTYRPTDYIWHHFKLAERNN